MWSRGWLVWAMLAVPPVAAAQTVKEADLVGGWRGEVTPGYDLPSQCGAASCPMERVTRSWVVLWPDHLWWFSGPISDLGHGSARWRLVGDTLWLANDYDDYMMPMVDPRIEVYRAKGYQNFATIDPAVIKSRSPFPVPDSVYWSKTFRDTVSACLGNRDAGHLPCDTWVYKVTKNGEQLSLRLLTDLSRGHNRSAAQMVLTRDSVVTCGNAHDTRGCSLN